MRQDEWVREIGDDVPDNNAQISLCPKKKTKLVILTIKKSPIDELLSICDIINMQRKSEMDRKDTDRKQLPANPIVASAAVFLFASEFRVCGEMNESAQWTSS